MFGALALYCTPGPTQTPRALLEEGVRALSLGSLLHPCLTQTLPALLEEGMRALILGSLLRPCLTQTPRALLEEGMVLEKTKCC